MKTTNLIRAKVALRVRPLSSKELSSSCQSVISYTNQQQIILSDEKIYDFDYVFNHESTQNDVYESCASPLVDKVFAGFDTTIFAYGQTGSGKTYTMGMNYKKRSSCKESYGIIPHLLEDVFKAKNSNSASKIQVSFTFVEIYNEVLYDLMTSKTQQPKGLREFPSAVKPKGIKEIKLNSCEEALQLFEEGCSRRVQEKTVGNQFSSRSHAIFTLNVAKYNKKGDAVTAKLNLVDLAGSEACSKNLNSNSRYKEGININLSLLTLGKVIRALRDTSSVAQSAHIPYRDSLLTRLLKDSLSSNCFILMIACVNPARYCLTETMTTLSYAATVCCIKTRPIIKTSTAKKTSRNPLQVLPPTPAWVKQGFNLTIATSSMKPTAVMESRSYRMTVGSVQREVQDSGCSPIFKEPLRSVFPISTLCKASNPLTCHDSNDTAQKLEFSSASKSVQKTLKDYFTPGVRHIDKENLPQQKKQKYLTVLPTKKDLSVLTPSSMAFLSPVPVQNFTYLTPLKDRTNIGDSPALNTRSNGKKYSFANLEDINCSPALNTRSSFKKHSFAAIEEMSDYSISSTLRKHSTSKRISLVLPEIEDINCSPALNTRSSWKKRSFTDIEEMSDYSISSTLRKHSTSKRISLVLPEIEEHSFSTPPELNRSSGKKSIQAGCSEISTLSVGTNEEKAGVWHSVPSAKTVTPIPLPDLDDEIFNLPRPVPAVKKYNLRERLTQHCYAFDTFDNVLWQPEKERKVRKTEALPKSQTARRKTGRRKTEVTNSSFLAFHRGPSNNKPQQTEKRQKVRKTEVLPKSRAMKRETRGRKSEIINGSSKTKLNDVELIEQETHNSEMLKLLNAGTLRDLQKLPAVGPKTAYIIFTWRKLKGPFGEIKDLRQIIGLPPSFFTKFSKMNLISL